MCTRGRRRPETGRQRHRRQTAREVALGARITRRADRQSIRMSSAAARWRIIGPSWGILVRTVGGLPQQLRAKCADAVFSDSSYGHAVVVVVLVAVHFLGGAAFGVSVSHQTPCWAQKEKRPEVIKSGGNRRGAVAPAPSLRREQWQVAMTSERTNGQRRVDERTGHRQSSGCCQLRA